MVHTTMGIRTFRIESTYPTDILDIVHELRVLGLVQGTDFDFNYNPPDYNWQTNEKVERYTVFTFYEDKWATWFALKYI